MSSTVLAIYPPAMSTAADIDARWSAVLSRDPSADGAFVYAVRTTHVYCRPSCPSRRPRREHVVFFPRPAASAAAGRTTGRRTSSR